MQRNRTNHLEFLSLTYATQQYNNRTTGLNSHRCFNKVTSKFWMSLASDSRILGIYPAVCCLPVCWWSVGIYPVRVPQPADLASRARVRMRGGEDFWTALGSGWSPRGRVAPLLDLTWLPGTWSLLSAQLRRYYFGSLNTQQCVCVLGETCCIEKIGHFLVVPVRGFTWNSPHCSTFGLVCKERDINSYFMAILVLVVK